MPPPPVTTGPPLLSPPSPRHHSRTGKPTTRRYASRRYRGAAIHLCCENYLRGLPPDCPEEYQDFWNGMDQYLDWFDVLHWSERPLRPDWNHLRSDDKEVAFVWSTEHKYAGCPDLIGEIGGVKVIADFKTSTGPYMNSFPDRGDKQGMAASVSSKVSANGCLPAGPRRTYWIQCDVALIIVSTEKLLKASSLIQTKWICMKAGSSQEQKDSMS